MRLSARRRDEGGSNSRRAGRGVRFPRQEEGVNRGLSVPPRRDVEGEIYAQLYGEPSGAAEPGATRVIGPRELPAARAGWSPEHDESPEQAEWFGYAEPSGRAEWPGRVRWSKQTEGPERAEAPGQPESTARSGRARLAALVVAARARARQLTRSVTAPRPGIGPTFARPRERRTVALGALAAGLIGLTAVAGLSLGSGGEPRPAAAPAADSSAAERAAEAAAARQAREAREARRRSAARKRRAARRRAREEREAAARASGSSGGSEPSTQSGTAASACSAGAGCESPIYKTPVSGGGSVSGDAQQSDPTPPGRVVLEQPSTGTSFDGESAAGDIDVPDVDVDVDVP